MMPHFLVDYLLFDYKDTEVEIRVKYRFWGDEEDGLDHDISIVENDTEFSNDELLEFIENDEKLIEKLYQYQSDTIEDYYLGYNDYVAERERE